MKPVIRYQSQLLYRKSYKPVRVIRLRPDAKRRPNVIWRSDNYPVDISPARARPGERMIAWLAPKG